MKLPKRVRRGELCCGGSGVKVGEPGICVGTSTDADRLEAFAVLRNDDGDRLSGLGILDGDSVTALTLNALRPFMFSLLISDGFLRPVSSGYVGGLSMDGYTGRISPTSGVGEGADEVEVRRNLNGFLALIGKLAVIGRRLM